MPCLDERSPLTLSSSLSSSGKMKPYSVYKMRFKSTIFVAVFVLLAVAGEGVYAQTASELRDKIDQKDAEIARLEREIASYQSELSDLGEQKNSLATAIKELDLTKKKLNSEIAVTQNKIEKTNLKISDLSNDISDKNSSIANNINVISAGIKTASEFESSSLLEILLSEKDFSEAWTDIDNAITLREELREKVAELKEVKGELEDTRAVTIDTKNELTALRARLADQQKIVVQNTNEKNKLLAQTKNSEASYQKLLADQMAKKQAFEKELEAYESQLKFILDPSSIPSGRVLGWPLNNILMTSPFGARWGRMHYGTDFRASVGTPVKSVAEGVVIGTGDTDLACPKASFGQWILIEHNNGLSSTYAHLSRIIVKKGDRVSRGSTIAYSGNTGSSTGPHLHLSVYASKDADGKSAVRIEGLPSVSCLGKTLIQPRAATGAYLDPMKYLPPYK